MQPIVLISSALSFYITLSFVDTHCLPVLFTYLLLRERILEYRDESQRLDQCSRLYDSSISNEGFELDASHIVQVLIYLHVLNAMLLPCHGCLVICFMVFFNN